MIVDHLIIGAPDLELGIRYISEMFAVEPVAGGRHQGFGTRNALLGLGESCYLEILAPDPEQEEPPQGYWMKVDQLETPRLIRWAARTSDITTAVQTARRLGTKLGEVIAGNRRQPDGTILRWHLSDPRVDPADGLIPFLIDWGDSPHPSATLPQGGRLLNLHGTHPESTAWQPLVDELQLAIELSSGSEATLSALIELNDGTMLMV